MLESRSEVTVHGEGLLIVAQVWPLGAVQRIGSWEVGKLGAEQVVSLTATLHGEDVGGVVGVVE